MDTINLAIIGVGNCASALVQGLYNYKNASEGDKMPGLMNPVLGGYTISAINWAAAFAVDNVMLWKDISVAISSCLIT